MKESPENKEAIHIPTFELFCHKTFLNTRCWNNFAVKDKKAHELGVPSLQHYLEEMFPLPFPREAVKYIRNQHMAQAT